MWLFYVYSTVKIRLLYLVFPLAESIAKAFCWLFLWNFKEKASTIFYDTAFCICNGTILSTVFFLFLVLLKYPPFQSLPCLLNPCSQRSLSNCFWAVYTSGRRAEGGRGGIFSKWAVGQGHCPFFCIYNGTILSYSIFFLSVIEISSSSKSSVFIESLFPAFPE